MTWFKSFSDGKGGFNTFEWSLAEGATNGIFGILLMLVFFVIFLMIIPILLIFTYPFASEVNKRITCVVSIIMSTLFLIDYSIGYVLWDAFNSGIMISVHKSLANIHATLIILNVFLFFMAKPIHIEIDYNAGRAILLSILLCVIGRVLIYPAIHNKVSEMRSKTIYISDSEKK